MQFTLSISEDTALRIYDQVNPFGGTVSSYAAQWATVISALPLWEQQEIRAIIDGKLKRLASTVAANQQAAPDAVAHTAGDLLKEIDAQTSQQLPRFRKPRAKSSLNRLADLRPPLTDSPNEKVPAHVSGDRKL